MERNADLIVMQCYAPLLVNVNPGASQWRPNLIGYDALNSFVSPSWYAQMLFNTHRGDEVLSATLVKDDPTYPLPYSVTRDGSKGLIYVKLVNPLAVGRAVRINLGEKMNVEPKADVTTLCSNNPGDSNSIEHPDAVKPVTSAIDNASPEISVTVQPYSLTIVTLKLARTK